jgi:hypothetical protein
MTNPIDLPPWYQICEIAATDVGSYRGLLQRIFDHELAGVVIKGAFQTTTLQRAAQRLQAATIPEKLLCHPIVSDGPVQIMEIVGRSLRLTPRSTYDEVLDGIRAFHTEVFENAHGFSEEVRKVLQIVAGDLQVKALQGPKGEDFCRALMTRVRPGGEVPFHFDNYLFYEDTAFRDLDNWIAPDILINFLAPMQLADQGGELELLALDWQMYQQRTGSRHSCACSPELLAGYPRRLRLHAEVGDLIVFDAGRIMHCVTPIAGQAERLTYLGHMGFRPEQGEFCYFV